MTSIFDAKFHFLLRKILVTREATDIFVKIYKNTFVNPLHNVKRSTFLHLHEIVEGLFSGGLGVIFSLQFVYVCVCLYVCVCPALLVNKIPAEQIHRFGRGFC